VSTPFIWFDLRTADGGTAAGFYRQMFGWNIIDAGVGGYRSWIGTGPQPWAGIVAAPPKAAGQWLPYVVVNDLDRATKQAVTLGATVVSEAPDRPAGTSGSPTLVEPTWPCSSRPRHRLAAHNPCCGQIVQASSACRGGRR
jgi:uncharacterized protein